MVGLVVCAGNIPAGECTQVGGRVTVRLGAAEETASCGETACRRHRSHGGSCQGTDGDSTCQCLPGFWQTDTRLMAYFENDLGKLAP